jgi:hypothetical protein
MSKKFRNILLGGDEIKTAEKPKYIFGLYKKRKGIWYYVFKNGIEKHIVGCRKRVIVSRFCEQEKEELLYFQKNFETSKSLHSKLKFYYFEKFVETIGPITSLRFIDSLDDWRDYYKKDLDDNFVINKLRKILS